MVTFTRNFFGQNGEIVELVVWPPELDGSDWRCKFAISGIASASPSYAMGADAIQSLLLALVSASSTLYYSQEYAQGNIRWDGGDTVFDLGLPVSDVVRTDIENKQKHLVNLFAP